VDAGDAAEPVGDWKAGSALRPVAPAAGNVLGSFDPFFRLSAQVRRRR
jgi:hypothetical protein